MRCVWISWLWPWRSPLSWLLVSGWSAMSAPSGLLLAEAGQSRYRIVIPAEAIASERYAAQEWQRCVERMSGARLSIVTDAEPATAHEIRLGRTAREGTPDNAGLGADGFVVQTDGAHLLVVGGGPRGTLNGVYTILEETLGVRWFTRDMEVVPRREKLELPALNERRVPALEYREVFWTEMMRDGDLSARHRLNGQHHRLEEKHGGPAAVYHPFVHSFDALIPRELFATHPEYFPFIDGRRRDGYVQRCLSNPEVLRLAIERVGQWIREHPDATLISVSQNDTINNCRCDDCRRLDDAEGSPAASLLRFVNGIAEAVEKEHPKIRIDTLAYQYTRRPPKTVRPRSNVVVRLCSIECCFAHPLESCPSDANRRFRDDIVAWQPVARALYVWDYTPNFAHYQQPFPNFDALQANVRFFVKHGVRGLFEQGNYSQGGQGEMGPLRSYVLAKLLWNPDTDVARHVREFTDAYYGRAASKIRDYLDVTHRPVREKGLHAHIYDAPQAPYLNPEILAQADQVLSEAETQAANDTERFRVQVARLPVWYVLLATQRVKGDEHAALKKRFLEIARQAGVTDIREGGSLEAWAK